MDEERIQNACLMTTSLDDDGKTILTYIPMAIDSSALEFFAKNGHCDNKQAVYFELDTDAKSFWDGMWAELIGTVEDDNV